MVVLFILYLVLFFVCLIGAAIPLGRYLARVFAGERTFLAPVLRPVERLVYRLAGVNEQQEMTGREYVTALVAFTFLGLAVLLLLQFLQKLLPLNPQHFGPVRWDTALNTAVSFATNTNWQAYSPEATMSYLTQMLGMTVQNFLSAGAGIAVAVALVRGFTRKEVATVGNFWVDLVRAIVQVLLPLSVLLALVLASQGVVQTLRHYPAARTLENAGQMIAVGPAASQIAIKQLGTNGGGFFNANSAHPFENPNWLTNFLEMLSMLLIPVALVFTFGRMVRNRRQGWALFWAMFILLMLGLGVALWSEASGNPILRQLGVRNGLNLNGKETRFGVLLSALWGHLTTATGTGAVNAMHDSLTPLAGLVCMFNVGIGEVIFGGVGTGLIGLLYYVLLTMFIAGLMIGRTPEFLGKKLGPYEMVMAAIGVLLPSIVLLAGSALAISLPAARAGMANPGAHGLSEILYAYTSAAGNNGSAFAGLNANTPFYNLTLGLAMLLGRFATLLPALAIAGSLGRKKIVPASIATFPTTGPLFVGMLVAVVMIVGALTYFPFFAIGPLLEHLLLAAGGPF
jgi:K+-transporting ATPase ATPase A chain